MAEARANDGVPADGRVRAVVEGITPSVDGGRFAAKRVVGDRMDVEADCFADGHDVLAARLLWRPESERECAPDHPYVAAHPEWFRRRPDGSVQYAENPPKKYQDIYPFNFESDDWRGLWAELKSVARADGSLQFSPVDNESIICYVKTTESGENAILTVVNLDPYHVQSGWIELDLGALGIDPDAPYQMHELLSGARYLWSGARNYVSLDPERAPAHIFRLRRRVRSERDFDYFL